MDEEVLALVIGGDEAKALLVAEPFDGSSCHLFPPGSLCAAKRGRCSRQQLRTLALLIAGRIPGTVSDSSRKPAASPEFLTYIPSVPNLSGPQFSRQRPEALRSMSSTSSS